MAEINLQELLEQAVEKINKLNLSQKLDLSELKIVDSSNFYIVTPGKATCAVEDFKVILTVYINLQEISQNPEQYDLTGVLYHELAHCLQFKELLQLHYLEARGHKIYVMREYEVHGEIWQHFVQELETGLNITITKK